MQGISFGKALQVEDIHCSGIAQGYWDGSAALLQVIQKYVLIEQLHVVELGFDCEGADAFTGGGLNAADPFWDFVYYSFVTLTTLGYGDVTPHAPFAKSLAYMEALVGQFYIAVLIASLIGTHLANRKSG